MCVGDFGEVLNTPEINKLFRWFGYQKRKQVTKFNPLKMLSMRGKKKKKENRIFRLGYARELLKHAIDL